MTLSSSFTTSPEVAIWASQLGPCLMQTVYVADRYYLKLNEVWADRNEPVGLGRHAAPDFSTDHTGFGAPRTK